MISFKITNKINCSVITSYLYMAYSIADKSFRKEDIKLYNERSNLQRIHY